MNRIVKRGLAGVAAAVLLAGAGACSTIAEPDNMVLQYTGGSSDGSHFKRCIAPSTKGPGVVNDSNFFLPTGERRWAIRADDEGDTKIPIEAGSKPDKDGNQGPKVYVYATTNFFLNTNCDGGASSTAVKWWETLGRRYGADINPDEDADAQAHDDGFVKMLYASIIPIIERAVRDSTPAFTADQIDSNLDGAYDTLEKAIEQRLATEIAKSGNFFCGPGYDRAVKASCPPLDVDVTDGSYADASVATARASVFAAQQRAQAAAIDTASKLATATALKGAGASGVEVQRLQNQLQIAQESTKQAQACAANPKCTVIVGSGAGVNVAAN